MSTLPSTTRADYPHVGSVSTRWNDNDRYGHVNNAVYYQYFDSVINEVLIHQGGLDIHRGEVVGFIVLIGAHVSNVFVAPTAQGQGVGGLMMAWAEAQTHGPLTLSVFTVNPNARRFYERLGFVVEGLKTIAFASGDHEVWRMRKDRAAPF